jgi:hypothetical protein
MGALAAVAEFPNYFQQNVIREKEMSPEGK